MQSLHENLADPPYYFDICEIHNSNTKKKLYCTLRRIILSNIYGKKKVTDSETGRAHAKKLGFLKMY